MKETVKKNFASDNNAGIAPECLAAIAAANSGHAPAYGNDEWTQRACATIRDIFEINCEVFFTFNGTASNSLALAHLCRSFHSVVCHAVAHVETDECGAPEFFSSGSKLLLAGGNEGKVSPAELHRLVHLREDIHYPRTHVLSITQATELGTVYGISELQELGALAHGLGLRVHMDGARFANALVSLNCSPKEITWKAGVDVLCLGGTKNGMLASEAVVFFNKEIAAEFDYRCKQAGQLASKMRFLAAPWSAMLCEGAWLRYAENANRMAALLASHLRTIPEAAFLHEPQANSVFVSLPPAVIKKLQMAGWHFYEFIGKGGVRLMCSWDTREEDVLSFMRDLREIIAKENSVHEGSHATVG
ncbi:MAG: low specificity L-threonine aldolase [Chthoniobacteraceae bacterium]|jgi:threonine aldolase